jgi:hypothetical protein
VSTRFRIEGLDELRELLRRLPEELRDEARGIIKQEADDAKDQIFAEYPEHTGNLRDHLYVSMKDHSRFGVGATVRNTAKHAWIFENGTQARHTAIGADRGAMPPGHVFIPIVIRRRASMMNRLADLLRQHGLQVTGA